MPTDRGIEVVRDGQVVRLLEEQCVRSSEDAGWDGFVLQEYRRVLPLEFGSHEHAVHTVHLHLDDVVSVTVNSARRHRELLAPGTVTVMPRGAYHRTERHAPLSQVVVALDPEFLARAVDGAGAPDIDLAEAWAVSDRQIAGLVQALRVDLDEGLPAGRLYGESLGTALAVYLARRYGAQRIGRRAAPHGGLSDRRLRRVLEHIDAHLDHDLGLRELAPLAGVSAHYFVQLFRQSVGTTPHRYVVERRIERAKRLLRDARRKVHEVASMTGFRTHSHFIRVFQRLVGVSPTVYRRNV